MNILKNLLRKLFATKKRVIFSLFTIIGLVILLRFSVFKTKSEFVTGHVERGRVVEELVLSGQIKADEHANLSFQTSGELNFLGVKEGDEVKKGQVLARLDTTVLYQTYLQAESNLRRYQASLDNTYDQLQGHESDESYTQRETRTVAEVNKDNAYRAFVAASENLSNATLRSPFEGVVTGITYPFTGANTIFSQPQIEILNPKTIYFEVSADQTEVIDISVGQKVKISLDSHTDKEIEGIVGFIGSTPKAGEVGAVYRVKVLFISSMDDYHKFKVGMTGDASFVQSEVNDTLFVPSDFIKADSSGRYLLVNKENNKVYVKVGIEGEDRVEIVEGEVKEGDIIYD